VAALLQFFEKIHLSLNGLTPQKKLEEYNTNYLPKMVPRVLERVTIGC